MIKAELRERLIQKIREIEDIEILEEIYGWLEDESHLGVYQLSEFEKGEVREAQEEIRKGKGISDEDVNKEIDEWLDNAE